MNDAEKIADELHFIAGTLGSQLDDGMTVTTGLYELAAAVQRLGNADAGTPMGGMEALGAVFAEGMRGISAGLEDLAQAVRDAASQ